MAEEKQCKGGGGGGRTKQRITGDAVFVMASGKKEKPIVIWKSEDPRCLKRFDKSVLPLFFCQKKAWMTGEIMKSVLTRLNHRLSRSNVYKW